MGAEQCDLAAEPPLQPDQEQQEEFMDDLAGQSSPESQHGEAMSSPDNVQDEAEQSSADDELDAEADEDIVPEDWIS